MGSFGYYNMLNNRKMLFATEEEYFEMLRENESGYHSVDDSESDEKK